MEGKEIPNAVESCKQSGDLSSRHDILELKGSFSLNFQSRHPIN